MAAKSSTNPFTLAAPRDANRTPVNAYGSFVTADATGTPQVSPITVSNTVINLAVPDNAVQLVISNNANALRISEISTVTGNYYVLPVSITNFVIDCAKMTNIYFLRDSADVTMQFMFVLL